MCVRVNMLMCVCAHTSHGVVLRDVRHHAVRHRQHFDAHVATEVNRMVALLEEVRQATAHALRAQEVLLRPLQGPQRELGEDREPGLKCA
jgi:hypothetical protein